MQAYLGIGTNLGDRSENLHRAVKKINEQKIELEMGRTHKSVDGFYTDRIIDIDILLYEDVNINESNLTIPHPLIWQRRFVYEPLLEIAPHLCQLNPFL